jgi:hypothetical protein
MVEYIPAAVKDLRVCMDSLYKHRGFNAVCDAIISLDNAIYALESRLPYFENIVNKKGEV